MEKEILDLKELQEYFGIKSRQTVYNLMEEGMPSFKIANRLKFERSVVLQWFKDRSARG